MFISFREGTKEMKENTQAKECFSIYTKSCVHAIPAIIGYNYIQHPYPKHSTTKHFQNKVKKYLVLVVVTTKKMVIKAITFL